MKNFLSQSSFLLNLGLLEADTLSFLFSHSLSFIFLTVYSTAGRSIFSSLPLQCEVSALPVRC